MKPRCLFVSIMAIVSPLLSQAQLLSGITHNVGEEKLTVVFCPNGIASESVYIEEAISDGRFMFDVDSMEVDETDVEIVIGRKKLGAHLTKGKTLQMDIKMEGGDCFVGFNGDGAEESFFFNRFTEAYNVVRYFSLTVEENDAVSRYYKLLTDEYQSLKAALSEITNKHSRDYYSRLNESKYKSMQAYIIANSLRKKGIRAETSPDYMSLLKNIDINDDIHRKTGLAQKALLSQMKSSPASKSDMGPYCMELIQRVKENVTNRFLYRELVRLIGNNYFSGDGSGDNLIFWQSFVELAGAENADIAKLFVSKLESFERLKRGKQAYDIMLTGIDGKTIKLSEVACGKLTYIDIWATWCGPCQEEIPYLKKLVEKYQDIPQIQFISISVDKDIEVWKNKVQTDKLQWPQYIIRGETANRFSKDWDITSIPRFILIDKNGNICSANTMRPSDNRIESLFLKELER